MDSCIDFLVFLAIPVAYVGILVAIYTFVSRAVEADSVSESLDDVNASLKKAFGCIDDDSEFTWVLDQDNNVVQEQPRETDRVRGTLGRDEDSKA